jgi:hypothetical protein
MQQQALADGRLQDRTSSKQAGWLRQRMSKYEELAASGFEMLHQLRQRGVDAILRDQLGLPIAKTRTRRFHGTHKLLGRGIEYRPVVMDRSTASNAACEDWARVMAACSDRLLAMQTSASSALQLLAPSAHRTEDEARRDDWRSCPRCCPHRVSLR